MHHQAAQELTYQPQNREFLYSQSYSILLTDDDEDQLAYFQMFLSKNGFRVQTANSAYEGLSLLQKYYFDLLICDFRMPVLSGIDFIEQVRLIHTIPQEKRIPILMLSGCNGCCKNAAISMGADAFCEKRNAVEDLIPFIHTLIQD